MCSGANPQYRCPCCERFTCSVECVKKHKLDFSCTGMRRTFEDGVQKVGQMGDSVLLGDFKFLDRTNETLERQQKLIEELQAKLAG